MDSFLAIAQVKWRTYFRQLVSTEAVVGQFALWAAQLFIFLVALAFGAILFAVFYLEAKRATGPVPTSISIALLASLGLLYLVSPISGMLPSRFGPQFDFGSMLYYPVSLRRFFLMDLASEAVHGLLLLMVPSMIALHVAIPAAAGRPHWGLLPLALTSCLVILLVKTLERLVAQLSERGRSIGDIGAAVLGAGSLFLVSSAASATPRLRYMILHSNAWWADALRLTPPMLTNEMIHAAHAGDGARYLEAAVRLFLYLPPAFFLCYRIWRRQILREGGGGRRLEKEGVAPGPWRIPLLTGKGGALLEKELKYLLRNPQVRIMLAVPAVVFLFKIAAYVGPSPGDLLGVQIRPSSGADVVRPSSGADVVRPSSGADVVRPSTGVDVVRPSTGVDVVRPSSGADVVRPSSGADVLRPSAFPKGSSGLLSSPLEGGKPAVRRVGGRSGETATPPAAPTSPHGTLAPTSIRESLVRDPTLRKEAAHVVMVFYLLLIHAVLFNNLFGIDGPGIKVYLLTAVPPLLLLRAKNAAVISLVLTEALILALVNQTLFRDMSLRSTLMAGLVLMTELALVAGVGDLLSVYFPKRSPYGKRLETSKLAAILGILTVLAGLAPYGLSLLLIGFRFDYLLRAGGVALCAGLAWWLYIRILLPRAATAMGQREARMLEAIVGGDE